MSSVIKNQDVRETFFFARFQNFNVTDTHVTLKWFPTLSDLTLLRNLIHAWATPVYIQGPIRQENENIVRLFDKRSYSKSFICLFQ